MKRSTRNITLTAWKIKHREGDGAELHIAECVAQALNRNDHRSADYWTKVAYELAEIEGQTIQ